MKKIINFINKYLAIFTGIAFGLIVLIMDIVTHAFMAKENAIGEYLTSCEPVMIYYRVIVGAVFIAFGVYNHVVAMRRKAAEAEANKNQVRYCNLFSSMLNGFALHKIIVDENGRPVDYEYLEINDAFERMTGLEREKIIGRRVTAVIPELKNDSFDWIGTYGRVALNNEKIQFEQYSKALGKWYNITAYSPSKGEFATVFEDITERKKIENVIRENQERLDTIFNSIQAGIMVIDRETHTIAYVNQAAVKMVGAAREQLLDQPCQKYVCSAKCGECPITDKGQKIDNSESVLLTADGRQLPIIKTVMEAELDGRPVLVESFVDITEQKRAEKLQAALYYISESAAKTENLPSLYAVIHDAVRQLINTSNFYIALYHEKEGILSFPYYVDEYDQPPQPRKMGNGLTEYVLNTKTPLLATPVIQNLLAEQGKTTKIGTPSVEWAGVPLQVGGRVLGVLVVQSYREDVRFGENALSILSFMSDNIALAIERKKVETEILQNHDTQRALASLLHLAIEDSTIEEILDKAIDMILSIPWLSLESRGGIFLVEDDPEVLVMKAQRNLADPIQKACARVPFGKCLCGRAAMTRQIQFADCLDDRHDTTYNGIIPHGHYCVPIISAEKVLGVIKLYVREGHQRSKNEETFLTSMADALAGIINRKQILAALQKALDNVKTLKGLVPICASCKKIRDDGGYWQQVEEYVAKHTEADFSHGLCDECAHQLYPDYFPDKKNQEKE